MNLALRPWGKMTISRFNQQKSTCFDLALTSNDKKELEEKPIQVVFDDFDVHKQNLKRNKQSYKICLFLNQFFPLCAVCMPSEKWPFLIVFVLSGPLLSMIGGKKGCLFSGLFGFHCSQVFFLNITKAKDIVIYIPT